MKNWILGVDLITKLDIRGMELFENVKRGLQPYDDLGQKMPPPDVSQKLSLLEKLDKAVKEYRSTGGLRRHHEELIRYYKPDFSDLTKYIYFDLDAIVDMEYDLEILKDDLAKIPDKNSWANYQLPKSKISAKTVLDSLLEAFYKTEDVSKFV